MLVVTLLPSVSVATDGLAATELAATEQGLSSSEYNPSELLVRTLDLRFHLRVSEESLTTEKVWELAPDQINAHRQAWILSPQLSLDRLDAPLRTKPKGKGRNSSGTTDDRLYGAEALSVNAEVLGFVRPKGPFFDSLDDLDAYRERPLLQAPSATQGSVAPGSVAPGSVAPGSVAPGSVAQKPARKSPGRRACPVPEDFLSREQALAALQAEAKLFESILSRKRVVLAERLANVVAPTATEAKARAKLIFERWVHEVEDLREEQAPAVVAKAKAGVLTEFLSQETLRACPLLKANASSQKLVARRAHRARPKSTSDQSEVPGGFVQRMDPIVRLQGNQTLGRAPAKPVAGGLAVRGRVLVGSKNLTGLFLLDFSQLQTLISPVFLREQGLQPWELAVANVLPRREFDVDSLAIGGYPIPVRRVRLVETEEWVKKSRAEQMQLSFLRAGCCSGILGVDFLAHQTFEVGAGADPYLRLLPRTGYFAGGGSHWIEASLVEGDAPTQSRLRTRCWWTRGSGAERGRREAITVLWESVHADALNDVFAGKSESVDGSGSMRSSQRERLRPTRQKASVRSFPGQLECSEEVKWELKAGDSYELDGSLYLRPATWLKKTPLVFDLPSGRIWFKNSVSKN
jgi:hypothetical protein